MALQTSGAIALSDIEGEFTGTAPTSLSEYYRAAGLVPSSVTQVPASGAISFSDFYGASNAVNFDITSDQLELNLETYLIAEGWDQATPVNVTVDSGVWIYSNTVSTAGLTIPSSLSGLLVSITNNGNIIGMGGPVGSDGGDAIANSATNLSITNASGAFIAGGGAGNNAPYGGGGAGQQGPLGGTSTVYGGLTSLGDFPSVSLCTVYRVGSPSSVPSNTYATTRGYAGGGGDGGLQGYIQYICNDPNSPNYGVADTVNYYRTGSAGGRALTGGQAPTGNSSLAGGFWGQNAGSQTGGAAISGTTVTLTNNGTVYGTTAT